MDQSQNGRGMASGEIPGQVSSNEPHATPRLKRYQEMNDAEREEFAAEIDSGLRETYRRLYAEEERLP